MVRLTLEEAQMLARATKAPPGRAKANEVLKACRERLQNRCGRNIDLEAEPMFHWQAYLAMHSSARDIFRSEVIGFLCEVFPEREPNASKLPGLTLRADFVCLRADGSAVRLHPSKGAEAKISEGSLESWRSGATPIFVLDAPAAMERRSELPLGPQLLSQPPPPPPPPPCTALLRPLLGARLHKAVTPFATAKTDFDGSKWGEEYVSFAKGARIIYQPHPSECHGWEYGLVVDTASPAKPGWFPPEYVTPDDADEVQPEDSASGIACQTHLMSSSDDSSCCSSLSMVSAAGQSERCFVQGQLIQKSSGEWINVENLKRYDYVSGLHGHVRVMAIDPVEGSEAKIEVRAGGMKLATTSSHRYMVIRGGRIEAAPASSLRPGDDVTTLWSGIQPVTEIRSFRDDCDVFRVLFHPDEPVVALSADGIYTKGHRLKPQNRRGGGCHKRSQVDTMSIPETAAEAEWV